MPCLRQTSPVFALASCSRKIPMICSSVNRLAFMSIPSQVMDSTHFWRKSRGPGHVVYPSPATCPCCGGALHKLGEDVAETLELIPRQWKVIQHVRESPCRTCEAITQPP